MHIDHIGIAVIDLEQAIFKYESLLNTACFKREIVEAEQVETAFFQTGESKVELLAATSSESVIQKFIEKRGEGLHHVAFAVDDITAEINRYVEEGYRLLSDAPKRGADNKLIIFLHPKEANGVLIELCQDAR
jgi:methylmalonyl-CoA/ethylmalonyl-CoA epimerase